MELIEIKAKIDEIKNTKDIENIEQILSYGDLGEKIIEVLNAVKNLTIPVVMPSSFSFNNYTKQKGDCNDCILRNECRPHTSTLTIEGKDHNCPLKFEENWA